MELFNVNVLIVEMAIAAVIIAAVFLARQHANKRKKEWEKEDLAWRNQSVFTNVPAVAVPGLLGST